MRVDEKRNPKTRATVSQLIERYFEVIDVDVQTMRGYRSKYDNHIAPLLGSVPLSPSSTSTPSVRSCETAEPTVAVRRS